MSLFQSQLGSIKTTTCYSHCHPIDTFQSQLGSIKTGVFFASGSLFHRFQSQLGSIKTLPGKPIFSGLSTLPPPPVLQSIAGRAKFPGDRLQLSVQTDTNPVNPHKWMVCGTSNKRAGEAHPSCEGKRGRVRPTRRLVPGKRYARPSDRYFGRGAHSGVSPRQGGDAY